MLTEFTEGCLANGIAPEIAARLADYGEYLLEANRSINLTGAKTLRDLLPHILDAATLQPYIRGPLIDIGSGGGLPAIPLAIICHTPITMVEAIGKKAQFLREALQYLNLKGQVLHARAERVGHEQAHRGRYACATARAVASAPTVAELTVPLLTIGGVAVLQRGTIPPEEQEAATIAASMLGAAKPQIIELTPTRYLMVITKHEETARHLPRRDGVPSRQPLGGSTQPLR